jgi:hypothetical protein
MKKYALLAVLAAFSVNVARADESEGFLKTIHHNTSTLTTTVPGNGDQNPYAIVVSPISLGWIKPGDVLVDNFNNAKNLQGTGTTIIDYNPSTKKTSLFAQVPSDLKGCPGGVGLSTAMTILKSGWVIVGSTPSKDGTTATKGDGCLIVLDANGNVASTIAGPNINDPWGDMAVIDNGNTATLFVSNSGFGLGAPKKSSPNVNKATVLRIELEIPAGKPPIVKSQTVIADGLPERADNAVFLIGPTGLALSNDQSTLYVSDALNNRIIAIENPTTRQDSAGNGREITKNGLLHQPLAMITAPNGNLLVTNGLDGKAVEVNPVSGKQVSAKWLDQNYAQMPPGSGDLFGIALDPSGHGLYYVEDDVNTLVSSQ